VDLIEKQVNIYMQGCEFGDPQIEDTMRCELKRRLEEAQSQQRPLRVYCGYDVTAPDIHLGHTITIRKLRQFQEQGHEVTFLIGTFTSLIGDPSDRDRARPAAQFETILKNAQTYAGQAFKILDPLKTSVLYNHAWLSKLSFNDLIRMASCFTLQQFMVRDRLHSRIERNEPLWLSELLYPIAQGYDAVFLKTDVQIGATEQLFNLMAARKIQELNGLKPQVCITYPVLKGTDGVNKMSKSLGNYIGIDEAPQDQYGKLMSLPDNLIVHYFKLVIRWTPEQVISLEDGLKKGLVHPMEAKKQLAWEIVDIFHGSQAAEIAQKDFERVHQAGAIPEQMPVFKMEGEMNIVDLLVKSSLCSSKSEARRAIEQKSIRIEGRAITGPDQIVKPRCVVQKGKRNFLKIIQ